MFKETIERAIVEALKEVGADGVNFTVERPTSLEHGDYATNAALVAGKLLKKNPQEVAQQIVEKLSAQSGSASGGKIEGVEKIKIAGAGFINFFLSRDAVTQEVAAAAHDKEWGKNDLYTGKKVMVEYTDPNPFKEFHIGHLMSNAIGESIARLLENSQATVVRANYQGDIGPHVAKAMWGKLQKPNISWGEAYVYGDQNYESRKEEIDELNKKLYEKSDSELQKLYESGRKKSLEHFEELYKKLGTKFDLYFFESETAPKGLEIIKKHGELFEQSEGAIVFRGKHTRVFVTSRGLPTYEAKELGLAQMKKEKSLSDTYITVTASEQSGFFEVVFEAIEKIFPELQGKLVHRAHGHMRFEEGKMSSRTGNVITGESLLEDVQKQARGRMDVAVGAVKYAVLKQGSGRDIIFDPEKSLSLEGDSGPYLQYACVRARSLLREAQKAGVVASGPKEDGKTWPSGLERRPSSAYERNSRTVLERTLIHFPEALARAAKELEPHYVMTYLTELAGAFNSWYASERVIGGPYPSYGLLLATAVEQTLDKGLYVLGIPAPEKM